ncbi:MAG: MarR family transcriptional regulator [Proteobacteria bacterium]|nr:MarR family transcriptional regulator [Pseudomonadota bacterium]MBU4472088.1 MarR family transcriptional regulator [Pseudomonadota bacterium]MCG2752913.1 MarR family transcriptional regulator [Desulfobacteraceae bacterium]
MADKNKIYNLPVSDQDKAAFLILCTAQEVRNRSSNIIKEYDLSMTQLTILHILDEMPMENVTVNTVRDLMVEDSPNVSRALNKLAAKDLITKKRSLEDQRVVFIAISQTGRDLHKICDKKLLGNLLHLSEEESRILNELLMKT